jgi:hypothetical protein
MKFEVMEWKMDAKGKTFTHKVSATVTDTVKDLKQLALDYEVTCLDTGQKKVFSEVRSAIDNIMDLRPSFKVMQQIRESL